MSTSTAVQPKHTSNLGALSSDYLFKEGIIDSNEPYETIYLSEEEIEKFMETYLKENPSVELETRYLRPPPIELIQDVEVKYLRPETPEIPPIIIKEVEQVEKEQSTLRIVQKAKHVEEKQQEPLVIREKPNFIPIPEPKFVYVQNITKKETNTNNQTKSEAREIKVEHVRSDSQLRMPNSDSFNSNNNNHNINNKTSRLEFEDQARSDRNLFRDQQQARYSFQEHASLVDYEEEFEHRHSIIEDSIDEHYRLGGKHVSQRTLEEERQLRLYEEKLKQTLYEEYLLKLEREKLERKLSEQGVFEERLRERSLSQDRLSQIRLSQSRLSQARINEEQRLKEDERYRESIIREEELRRIRDVNRLREEQTLSSRYESRNSTNDQNTTSSSADTSTYRSIKFAKVTDQNDLLRYNQILNDSNGNSSSIRTSTIDNGDLKTSSILNEQKSKNLARNEYDSSFKQQQQQQQQSSQFSESFISSSLKERRSSSNVSKPNSNEPTLSSNLGSRLIRTESPRRTDDLRNNNSLYSSSSRNNLSRLSDRSNNDLSRSGSGIRKQKMTSITSYYSSNYPNQVTEKNVYVTKYVE